MDIMIKNSNILIMGGYGFIGAHIAKLLSEPKLNNKITVFDANISDNTTGNDLDLNKNSRVSIIQGSILDEQDMSSLPKNFNYIIHAAGFLGIEKVAEMQLKTMDINILGTRNCLDLAVRQKVKTRILIFSTSEIYGIHCEKPNEDDSSIIPMNGKRWCYATSKVAAEYYLKAYIQEHRISGSIIRPFNVFGAYRYGTNAMTNIINKAIHNEEITISGDGHQIRSWCAIEDLCAGVMAILEKGSGTGDAYNIGNPNNAISILGLAELIVSITDSKSKINVMYSISEDVLHRVPNISKANKKLGYSPKININTEIKKVADWMRTLDTVQ